MENEKANSELPIAIPWQRFEPTTLTRLVEEFVSREGTDYGQQEATLQQKVEQVLGQIRVGKALVVFDAATESFAIVLSGK